MFSLGRHPPMMTFHASSSASGSPYTSIAVISRALPQPAIKRNQPVRHLPMRLREEVKCSNGNMAKGS